MEKPITKLQSYLQQVTNKLFAVFAVTNKVLDRVKLNRVKRILGCIGYIEQQCDRPTFKSYHWLE